MSTSPLTIPEHLDLIDEPGGVIIRRSWFTWAAIPLAIFAVFWDGFIVFFYYMLLHSRHSVPTATLFFPLLHLGAGVFITYFAVSSFCNQTDITLTPDTVQIRTGPLPWFGNKTVAWSEITGTVVRTRYSNAGSGNFNRSAPTFAVLYVDGGHKERTLIARIPNQEQAEFIKAKIDQARGLQR